MKRDEKEGPAMRVMNLGKKKKNEMTEKSVWMGWVRTAKEEEITEGKWMEGKDRECILCSSDFPITMLDEILTIKTKSNWT